MTVVIYDSAWEILRYHGSPPEIGSVFEFGLVRHGGRPLCFRVVSVTVELAPAPMVRVTVAIDAHAMRVAEMRAASS